MVQWPWHRLCHNFKSFFLDANGVFLICSLILWLKMIHTQKTKQPTKTTGNGSVFLPFQKSNFSDKGDIKSTVTHELNIELSKRSQPTVTDTWQKWWLGWVRENWQKTEVRWLSENWQKVTQRNLQSTPGRLHASSFILLFSSLMIQSLLVLAAFKGSSYFWIYLLAHKYFDLSHKLDNWQFVQQLNKTEWVTVEQHVHCLNEGMSLWI